MRNTFAIAIFIIFQLSLYSQESNIFEIERSKITDSILFIPKDIRESKEKIFFEDNEYIVTKSCSGEWGGTIWFKNKATGKTYSSQATCPVAINKIDERYVVSNSLAHLSGSSEVIEIQNPELISVFKMPKLRKKKKGKRIYYVGDDESKSRDGLVQLWGEIGTLILTSFIYNNELYHIITKNNRTFIGQIVSGRMNEIQTISDDRFWGYSPTTYALNENKLAVKFYNSLNYIVIEKNHITFFKE